MTDEELKQLVADNSRNIAGLQKSIEETGKQIKRTDKQIGDIGNKFGRFTEGLFYPSLEKILLQDFNLENVAYRYKARRNGDNIELDMLGISNGKDNKAIIVEVKSKLRDGDLDDLIKTLKVFPKFFPQHKDKKLYGVIAAVGISDEQKRRAEKFGLYVVKISDDVFKLVSGKSFQPQDFSKAK